MSWHHYNESHVERGRVMFDLGFADRWSSELDEMNKEKRGRPYEFPESYLEFLSFFKVGLDAPYRVIEGMTEALSEYLTLVKEIHFTQIRRRVLAMIRKNKPEYVDRIGESINDDPLTVIVDSTGLSTTNKGGYIEEMWTNEKKKFVKLHIVADKKTGKIAGFRIRSQKPGTLRSSCPWSRRSRRRGSRRYSPTPPMTRRATSTRSRSTGSSLPSS
jgi:hypothetical protein